MELKISQVIKNSLPYVKLETSKDFDQRAWNLIKNSLKQIQKYDFKEETESYVIAEWFSLLQMLGSIKAFRDEYSFNIDYTHETRQFIKETISSSKRIGDGVTDKDIGKDEDVLKKLDSLGFNKLILEDYQIRDLRRLLSVPHGANFSVQGSGKTAVTLALHLFLRNNKEINANSLFVVSPKNAFLAWQEDGFDEILDENCKLRKEGLVDLKGNYDQVKQTLLSGKKNFIVNYEKLINITSLVGQFVLNPHNRVHIILDESHKIKSEHAQRTDATRSLATLPFLRKDILTGTPLPNKVEDINTQYKFLYPFSDYTGNTFFVRTTKNELNLPKPTRKFINVEMSDVQIALYAKVMGNLKRYFNDTSLINSSNFREVRKSVIRLIMISSNPILLTNRMIENGEFFYGDQLDNNIHLKLQQEMDQGGPPKVKMACAIARNLAKEGKKTVIWSYFKNNIEFIGKYALKDLNAEYIHGGVNVGSEEEYDTRKYKIKKFKDPDSDCKVLVANYASCAEGISLHHVCHDAIYVDRSFQADQYLQSEDRISRLGNNDPKNIYILQSAIPGQLRNIDMAIKNALERKIDTMGRFLDDPRLIQMAEEETEGEMPIDTKTTVEDIKNIMVDLLNLK